MVGRRCDHVSCCRSHGKQLLLFTSPLRCAKSAGSASPAPERSAGRDLPPPAMGPECCAGARCRSRDSSCPRWTLAERQGSRLRRIGCGKPRLSTEECRRDVPVGCLFGGTECYWFYSGHEFAAPASHAARRVECAPTGQALPSAGPSRGLRQVRATSAGCWRPGETGRRFRRLPLGFGTGPDPSAPIAPSAVRRLRYHARHHYFPGVPDHNLITFRRKMIGIPQCFFQVFSFTYFLHQSIRALGYRRPRTSGWATVRTRTRSGLRRLRPPAPLGVIRRDLKVSGAAAVHRPDHPLLRTPFVYLNQARLPGECPTTFVRA